MAIGEIVEPHEIVKANNDLFRCKYKIKDVLAARIFMAFASLVDHKDVKENQSFVEYKIAADSILSDTCMGGDNYKQLKDAAYSLVDHKIELRISKSEFYFYTLFSKIGYKDGIIIGEFHKDLMPFFLIAKEKFTKVKLTEYVKLPSIYSQCIFVFLKSWSDRDEIVISISKLHEILDTPQSCRNDFRQFRTRVLEKAYKDINEKTNLSYEWEAIKQGRSFSEIKFKFIKNDELIQDRCKVNKDKMQQPQLTQELQKHGTQQKLNALFAKFPDYKANYLQAGIKWYGLNAKCMAPLAEDVPDDNNLGIMDFLDQWKRKFE